LDIRLDRHRHSNTHIFSPTSTSFGQLSILLVSLAILMLGSVHLFRLNSAVSQLSSSLEGYSLAVGSGWTQAPEPITITSTAFQASRWQWFNGEDGADSDSAASESPESPKPNLTSSTSPSVALTSPPAPSAAETPKVVPTLTAEPSSSVSLFQPLAWNISWSWPEIDRELAVEKLLWGAEKVWQLLRKIYHYPLEPT
jgi:hypothetical protein